MKKLILPISILIIALMSSCSTVKVVSEVSKTIDSDKYKTYTFLGWQQGSSERLNDFDKQRIRDAFKSELSQRGLTYQESGADMAITLYVVIDEKTSVTAYTDLYDMPAFGGYYRFDHGWGYGYASTSFQENDYLEGTLVMDVFDASTKEQIWQGIAISTVVQNPQKREKTIPNKISILMNKFPIEITEE